MQVNGFISPRISGPGYLKRGAGILETEKNRFKSVKGGKEKEYVIYYINKL
jgi:hypothetical protein